MIPKAQKPFMPGYGLEECENWHALPWSWAAERLTGTRAYWLATVSPNDVPHALPVWGVWDESRHQFIFGAAEGSRKVRNLAARPHATVTTESTTECVSLHGTVAPVGAEELDRVIGDYVAKYASEVDPDALDPFLRQSPLFELTPIEAFGIIETPEEFAARATKWVFSRT